MTKRWQLPLVLAASLALSGCSWFGSDDEVKPNPLVEFEAEKKIERLWSASAGAGSGSAYLNLSPAVEGERIFAVDAEGEVFAFDRNTGERLWQADLDTRISGGTGAGYGVAVVATIDGFVVALDSETGKELWRTDVRAEVVSQPQINEDLVVVQAINGTASALDRLTGEHRWTYDARIPNLTLRGTSSPIVIGNATFVGFASGKLVALDNATGNEIWSRRVALAKGRSELERMVDIDGRALLHDRILYVPSYQGRLAAIDPFSAQILWAEEISTFHSLAEGYGNIYVSDSDDAVQAVDRNSSASVWRQPALSNRAISAPVATASEVLVADFEGYLHAMSQLDGHFVARYKFDSSGVSGDMLAVDDIIYLLSNDGQLEALTLN